MNTQENQTVKMTSQKRPREDDVQPTFSLTKKRQPKSLFRPWSDEQVLDLQTESKEQSELKKDIIASNSAPNSVNYQPKIVLPTAPVLISPLQLAIQQQQRQTALALQQAIYQRQLIMAHVWAQQRQQMIVQHHQQQLQQMRQQLFAFGQKQGPK